MVRVDTPRDFDAAAEVGENKGREEVKERGSVIVFLEGEGRRVAFG
jgi:hypothetical protein